MTTGTTILIIHHEQDRYFDTLCRRFPDLLFHSARNDAEVAQKMAELQPQILLSFRCDPISTKAQSMAARTPCVKWVQVAGAGYDHLGDLDELKCQVTNCSGVLSRFQAETVIGAMINLNFGFYRYQQQQREKLYRKLPWRSLEGQKLLLLGMGHIGRAVAVNARHFGMHITAIRSRIQDSPEADVVCTADELPVLLPEVDFVSLHLPYCKETHHFFDAKMFGAMKESAYFINTARGNIVDEDALIAALKEKRIAGAYLDVFREEPLPQLSQLWQLDNLLLTPHYCDAVDDWHERFADFFADNLQRWIAGEELHNSLKK
ncbi:phosphoglycerate dehydrogenase-like oxidoreductase [Desulfocapsa sulfexigens DSM 10523]|uniref:Phosphoglycerate dehydrogenase-like oxidoreductase n=1 Tax=Desulfocapsa sulfexigens (strain DSM 10523 / SB164P1) TaxID=1167006 RepID=M1PEB2_DESSD|nr:D-2-hydroxyacid dehydrogenase [Desulfocapsa sulfexigens]AGF78035.1 phosphoglycerate dehydrogenase-like oxidoreductase [Desulfocapsa sulfexigens DSM 10523]